MLLLAPHPAQAQAPETAASRDARITVMVLPAKTDVADLAAIDGAAVGLLSAGIGSVPASQTYLDIGQGARLNNSLYDGGVPIFQVDPRTGIADRQWRLALARVADAPTDLEPGLLAATLARAGVDTRADPDAKNAAVVAADQSGRINFESCLSCAGLTVLRGDLGQAERIAQALSGDDLLIAIQAPPAADNRQLAVAIAGLGEGTLESRSTRIDGYVLATDLAPTILDRVGAEVPAAMSGQVLSAESGVDVAALESLDDRLAAVSPRRGEAVGWTLIFWAAATLLAVAVFRRHGAEMALPLLALSVVLLPAALLLTAALEPAEGVERAIAWLGPPAASVALLRLLGGWRALGVACALTVGAHAIDVVVGSPLTSRSLLGPNPALGVRFYGIGNELEAILIALVVIGAGAGLAGFWPNATPARRAVVFAITALVAVAAFAPGRFGADVGAAIAIPAAAAVAIAAVLQARRLRLLLLLATPAVALLGLAALDLMLGGDAHLSRSVLEAGGLDDVGQVAERRLRLGATSFERYADSPVLWATVILIGLGIGCRRRVLSWFDGRPEALAAFLGAAAGTLVGTLANDSGALLLMVGTALTSLCAAYAWALRSERV